MSGRGVLIRSAVAGFIAGALLATLIGILGYRLFTDDAAFMASSVGLGIGNIVGGNVAVHFGKSKYLGLIMGALFVGLMLINVLSFQHPGWFIPITFVCLAIGTALVYTMEEYKST